MIPGAMDPCGEQVHQLHGMSRHVPCMGIGMGRVGIRRAAALRVSLYVTFHTAPHIRLGFRLGVRPPSIVWA